MNIKIFRRNLLLKKKNTAKGKITIQKNVILDISSKAELNISEKLCLGASDWKNDNRPSGLKITGRGQLKVEKKEVIYTGCYISIGDGAVLDIKGNGYINHGCNIDCWNHIQIGKNTIIAKQVLIRDSDNHDMVSPGYVKSAPIIIGDHCWIGTRACILKGVTIGDGAVIAAGAVVVRDVPPHSLVAGVPARVVKENILWR